MGRRNEIIFKKNFSFRMVREGRIGEFQNSIRTITHGEVSTLNHKVWNDSMEGG